MRKRILPLVMMAAAGYFLYSRRYRVMNIVLGKGLVRRMAVSTIFALPGTRNRMMESVFGGLER